MQEEETTHGELSGSSSRNDARNDHKRQAIK